jgi:hypothetical protein
MLTRRNDLYMIIKEWTLNREVLGSNFDRNIEYCSDGSNCNLLTDSTSYLHGVFNATVKQFKYMTPNGRLINE